MAPLLPRAAELQQTRGLAPYASEAQALVEDTEREMREAARQRARTERDVLGKPEPPPTIRFVGYNPRTGHTSILIVPSRAVAEVIEGGAHSLLLAPGKRFDLARAVSAQLHLEFPRNAPPELVLPWSEKQLPYIGAVKDDVNARAPRPPEERARGRPNRLMRAGMNISDLDVVVTVFRDASSLSAEALAAQAEAEAAAAAAAEAAAAEAAAAERVDATLAAAARARGVLGAVDMADAHAGGGAGERAPRRDAIGARLAAAVLAPRRRAAHGLARAVAPRVVHARDDSLARAAALRPIVARAARGGLRADGGASRRSGPSRRRAAAAAAAAPPQAERSFGGRLGR